MSTTFGQRLDQALEHSKKSRAQLAKVLVSPKGTMGVSSSAVGQVISGKVKAMTAENSARAAKFLRVSHYWLATGLGAMVEAPAAAEHVAEEPPARYGSQAADLLLGLSRLLQHIDAGLRPGVADVLAAWARDGGPLDRLPALISLLTPPEKQHRAA